MIRLDRILLYVRNLDRTASFYVSHFGFSAHQVPGDRIIELVPADGGSRLMLHKAGKAQKIGQSTVKLVFNVEKVEDFCTSAEVEGLSFGPVHQADGYQFANAKDPDGNSIQVTSRPVHET